MNREQKIYLALALILIIVLIGILSYSTYKRQKEQKQQKAKEEVQQNIESSIGGTIHEEGFEIGYLEDKKQFTITITKNPFKENREKAFDYLKSKGIDISKIDYIIFASKNVDVSEEELYE